MGGTRLHYTAVVAHAVGVFEYGDCREALGHVCTCTLGQGYNQVHSLRHRYTRIRVFLNPVQSSIAPTDTRVFSKPVQQRTTRGTLEALEHTLLHWCTRVVHGSHVDRGHYKQVQCILRCWRFCYISVLECVMLQGVQGYCCVLPIATKIDTSCGGARASVPCFVED